MASKSMNSQQLTAEMAAFGARLAAADCTRLSGDQLHKLVGSAAGLESQIAVFRANLLSQIDRLGGDPIDSQKRNAKSSHGVSKKNADTAKALEKLPNVKTKMSQGSGMSANKASLLAGAAKKTTAEDVNGDDTLLQRVTKQDEDAAKKTIDTWVRERQSNAQRKSQRQKNIDERQFLLFLKDGMIHTHGKLPANVRNLAHFRRWEAEKSRLWRLDGGRDSAHRWHARSSRLVRRHRELAA